MLRKIVGLIVFAGMVQLLSLVMKSNNQPSIKLSNLEKVEINDSRTQYLEINRVYNGPNCVYVETNNGVNISAYHCFDKDAKTNYDSPIDVDSLDDLYLPRPIAQKSLITVTNNSNVISMVVDIIKVGTCSAGFEINQLESNLKNGTKDKTYYLIRGDSGAPITQQVGSQELIVGVFWQAVPNLEPASDSRSRTTNGVLVFKPCK
jgi:hypothetical protein